MLNFFLKTSMQAFKKMAFQFILKQAIPQLRKDSTKKKNQHLDIVFSVTDIETLYKELADKSVKIVQEIRTMPYGKEFYLADPDDYIISFVEEV